MRSTVWISVVVLAACGGAKKTLDRADVEAKVSAETSKLVGVQVASAGCPKAIAPAASSSFTCNVTFQGGGTLPVKVDQTDATGALSIVPVGDWLLGDRMENDLTTELFLVGHPEAKVDCGGAVIAVTLPAEVKCTVTNGGTTAKGVAVSVDAQRHVNWKLVATL